VTEDTTGLALVREALTYPVAGEEGWKRLLVGGVALLVLFPGTTYSTAVDYTDTVPNETSYQVYDFQDLSPRGKSVFLEARNRSDGVTIDRQSRTPSTFEYPTDTAGYVYVEYENDYYAVATSQNGCPAALCTVTRVFFGTLALTGLACLGYGGHRYTRR